MAAAMHHVLASLARRWLQLHEEIKTHTAHLKRLTQRAAPDLTAMFGVGFDSAAELLATAGDNNDRISSEAAFAKLCGVCPIPASSGKTSGRHRLNRGGNRRLNFALHIAATVQASKPGPGRDYYLRKRAAGKSKMNALGHCMSKALNLVWGVWRNGVDWDPDWGSRT